MSCKWQASLCIKCCLFLLLFNSCAKPSALGLLDTSKLDSDLPGRMEIVDVPFFSQELHQCGPAALAMVLAWNGQDVSPKQLEESVYIPARKGSLPLDLLSAARRRGAIAYLVEPTASNVFAELSARHPIIVLLNMGLDWFPIWHYAVLIGFDLKNETVVLRSGTSTRSEISFSTFETFWRRSNYWGLVVLAAEDLPVTATKRAYLQAALGLERAKHWKEASLAYRMALTMWPTDLIALTGLANSLMKLGDLDGAARVLGVGYQHYQDSPPLLNNYAHVLAKQGKWLKAHIIACKAISLGGPYRGQCVSTLREIEDHIHAKCAY